MAFNIQQKKGDPENPDGRITVYAAIDIDPADLAAVKHSFASMVHNGFLVAQGNFKDQYNFRDFLQSELGISLEQGFEEGLSQLIERMDGLESTLDPQKLKERLENMNDLEDFIPTPAKIVPFHSEAEICAQEGDVFFTGTFKNIGNAVLAVQALPMLYQAHYRECEGRHIRNEIESILSQIERSDAPRVPAPPDMPKRTASTEETLLKEYIPRMIYSKKEPHAFETAAGEFRLFMKKYRFQEDIETVVAIISGSRGLTEKENRLLELYAKKIACVEKEDFALAEDVSREILRLRGKP
ncbi:MAG: hypothetical protein JW699_04070 [Chitinispirillaceae bacterium]|nr:hypothetical protein [Chitinispirillaceae bacterium]